MEMDDIHGLTLLGCRHTELGRSSRLLKRLFAWSSRRRILIALLPLMLLIAIAIRLDSARPGGCSASSGSAATAAPSRLLSSAHDSDAEEHLEELRHLNEIEECSRWSTIESHPRRADHQALVAGRAAATVQRAARRDEPGGCARWCWRRLADRGPLPAAARPRPGITGVWQSSVPANPAQEMVRLDFLYVADGRCGTT